LKINGIDKEKCIDCLKCVKVCPSQLFTIDKEQKEENQKVHFQDPFHLCVRCGHCIAVCPTEAIDYEGADEPFTLAGKKKPEEIVPYDKLLKIVRLRRSMRHYKDEKVPKEQIAAVLEAMRYAPSASNRQGWRYVVITDEKEIAYLSQQTAKFFTMARRALPFRCLVAPFVPKQIRRRILNPKVKKQLVTATERIKRGEDIVFFDAPCVIILYAREYSNDLAANDAGIAFTHGMLAAQSLGLGTCWIGFAQRRLQSKAKLRRHFNIPRGFKVLGVMTLGIPAIQYQRGPPRRELRVHWIE
jgi:nitroreductase/ferredoxin